MKKKFAAIIIFIMLFMMAVPASADTANGYPEITANAAVVFDIQTGKVMYDKNKDQRMSPASMTKIMTALVVLENMEMDDMIKVGPNAVGIEGSTLELVEGEELRVRDLLYGLMLKSTNDSAVALAEGCAGSVEAFADLMNQKAMSLGLQNTHFVTPNGLTDPDHYTTPYDMGLILKEAVNNKDLLEIMSTAEYTIDASNLVLPREVVNSNRLLADDEELEVNGEKRTYRYDGLVCGKTGYTEDAGSCLAEYVDRGDGMGLIAVTMKSTREGQYSDMIRLLDSMYDHFKFVSIFKKGDDVEKVKIPKGGEVMLTSGADIGEVIEIIEGTEERSRDEYDWTVKLDKDVRAPLSKGDEVGKLILSYSGTEMGKFPVCVNEDVKASVFASIADVFSGSFILKILLALIIFIFAVLVAGFAILRPKRKVSKRRAKKEREQEQRERKNNALYDSWEATTPSPDKSYYEEMRAANRNKYADDEFETEEGAEDEDEMNKMSIPSGDEWPYDDWKEQAAKKEQEKKAAQTKAKKAKTVKKQEKKAAKKAEKEKKIAEIEDLTDIFVFKLPEDNDK